MALGRHIVIALALALAGSAIVACSSGHPSAPDAKTAGPDGTATATAVGPMFHKDVAPILQNHCQKCHQSGGLAPFSLVTYEDAKAMAPSMSIETKARRMPPWGAQDTEECKPRLPWNHDERLTDVEIATIAAWDAAGAPEGDPKDAPPPKTVATIELQNANLTLEPKTAFVSSGTRDQFRCFVLDAPSLSEGGYIEGMHIVPGNRQVVHHAVVFSDPQGALAKRADASGGFECSSLAMAPEGASDGQANSGVVALDVWTPGGNPVDLPPNIAMPLPKGSKLVMQIHYSPGGKINAPDLTKVQVRVRAASAPKPEYLLFTTAVGNFAASVGNEGLLPGPSDSGGAAEFKIPANVRDHVERMQVTIPARDAGTPAEIWIYGVMAHQHLAGIDVKVDLERGADSQCLVQDKWDFHWQRMYTYAAPVEKLPTLAPGDKIKLRCTYDNSMMNRRLGPEYKARGLQPMDLSLGEQTLDEMCLVIPQLLVRHP